jgi:hypothetical protein
MNKAILSLGKVWGVHCWSIRAGKSQVPSASPDRKAYTPLRVGDPIVPSNRVGEIVDRYPRLLATFASFGFKPLFHSLLRKAAARNVTVAAACRTLDVDVEELVGALNQHRERLTLGRRSLHVLH